VLELFATGDEAALKSCGLSRQKKLYLIDLARHFAEKKIPSRRLASMSDDEVIESLTAVNGIGRWTAEMFLIFTLNRPDLLPVDDLGLQTCARDAYGLKERPKKAELEKLAEPWRPYRSIATWYLWRGGKKVEKKE
jgi:DNA-3-methyladenine glycosylase II